MQMIKLKPVDTLREGDYIKAKSFQKAVPIVSCVGLRVGTVDFYMDEDFEAFYRPLQNNEQN